VYASGNSSRNFKSPFPQYARNMVYYSITDTEISEDFDLLGNTSEKNHFN
jgi:hypothetical protein